MPPNAVDLESYRRDGEAFLAEREEAEYLHGAGHTSELPLARIYERHGHLFSGEAAAALRARAADTGSRALAKFAVDGHLGGATRVEREAVLRAEADATVVMGGETTSFRAARTLIANEPDADERARIEASCMTVVVNELNPLHEEIWAAEHAAARALGASSYRGLYGELKGVDLDALASQAERLLAETEGLYEQAMDRELRLTIGLGLARARRSDLPHLFRAVPYDRHFPGGGMLRALEATLAGLGLDLRRQRNVTLDTEARPRKSPRAFCAPVRVPGRVYLVIAPIGGADDYEALFHEAGHTEHFANTSAGLPFEARCLGDDAVTEGYAFLLEGLTYDRAWLAQVIGYPNSEDYRRHIGVKRLYFFRRYAAKLAYELRFHEATEMEGLDDLYRELLSRASLLQWPSELYLEDIDQELYVVNYIRAWALELALRTHLRERFGTRWFADSRAGGLLRELWNEGQRLSADELAAELGLPPIDLSLLTDEAVSLLA